MAYNIDQTLSSILQSVSPKQQRVLEDRFGLQGKELTLQEIGDELGVTRERVRQIEKQTLERVAPQVIELHTSLIDAAHDFLEQAGGVRRDDYFIRDLRQLLNAEEVSNLDQKLRFVLLVSERPNYHKETTHIESFWYTDEQAKRKLFSFLDELLNLFKKKDKHEILEQKIYMEQFQEVPFYSFTAISKQFGVNPFGDFGLKDWPEIQPKVIRDKAHLVLYKQGEPLHFEDIARLIHELGIDEKPVHTQTVHNELIKDERFVLVGRGMYGLKEHGYSGGTVREVIDSVLQEYGPLTAEEVVERVGERKILKRNTILLNLQNRQHFMRREDGTYYLKTG